MSWTEDFMETKKYIDKQLKKNQFDNKIVAISNDLARSNVLFTLEEEQLLMLALSQFNSRDKNIKNSDLVRLKKTDVFEKLGLKSQDRYSRLKKTFKSMQMKTFIDLKIGRDELMGIVIISFKSDYKSEYFDLRINPDFMPYLEQLGNFYAKLELDSIVQFQSKFSLALYKYMMSWNNQNYDNERYLTTKELKELFGLKEDDYVSNGKFMRNGFEKKTIDVAINEINNKVQGLFVGYTKIKKNGRILAYSFEWADMSKMKNNNPNF